MLKAKFDRYKSDVDSLIQRGETLWLALVLEFGSTEVSRKITEQLKTRKGAGSKSLPSFSKAYQPWYSEAKVLVKQLLPDRFADFVGYYESPKGRSAVTCENYRIEDCLLRVRVVNHIDQLVVGPAASITLMEQQIAIVQSVKVRLESSLFDILHLVQTDLFDSEIEVAFELTKRGFHRAAGAVAGVVLERHLAQVCSGHGISVPKKSSGIADLNNALKAGGVVEMAQWRFVQHLADVRNKCVHNKLDEPTSEEVRDLISGVAKITKTLL